MVDIGKLNPYQLYTNPLPIPPSSGGVGDFLRNVFSKSPAVSTTQVPTAPIVQAPIRDIPVPANLFPTVTQTASRQVQPIAAPVAKQPALNNFLPSVNRQQVNKQNLDYTNPEARVAAPRGYTPPTAVDLATSKAVSDAYWAPYRRAAAIQNENLGIKRLEAQAKLQAAQPKTPTLRDQLYGQAAEAAQKLYELDVEAANTLKTPEEQAKARIAAQRKRLQGIIDLAQPKAAEAGILRGE